MTNPTASKCQSYHSFGYNRDLRAVFRAALFLLLAPFLQAAPQQAAIRGLPITRSYPLEEIGEVPRSSSLAFDSFGRLAVVYEGFYTVLNDTTWLEIGDKSKREVRIAHILQGEDGQTYYGGTGDWGRIEKSSEGQTLPHSFLAGTPPAWAQSTEFVDLVVTKAGAYFSGWSGVVYWDFAKNENRYFPVFGISKILRLGESAFVSTYGGQLLLVDSEHQELRPVEDPSVADLVVNQAAPLDDNRTLVATRESRFLVFNGKTMVPWVGQTRNRLEGSVSALLRLEDGGIAAAVTGKGLYVLSAEGEILSALESSEYHRIISLTTREPGVLWALSEDGVQKVFYGSPLSVFGQRQGITLSWPVMGQWKGETIVTSRGFLYHAIAGASGAASRFELFEDQPSAGAWGMAAKKDQLLIGNARGLYQKTGDGPFVQLLSNLNIERLAFVGDDLCFAIGRIEIAVLKWNEGRWTECAKRIPSFGYPPVVHATRHAVWVELGAGRVARLSLQDGQLRARMFENQSWKSRVWVNLGIVDDIVVLSGGPGERAFFDDKAGAYCDAPELSALLDKSPVWLLRILKDDTGTLWGTHEKGLVMFTPRDGGYKVDASSFALINERYPIIQLLPGNQVWLSTGQSLYRVERRDMVENGPVLRPTLVSVVESNSNRELLGSVLSTPGMLRVPYTQNSLNFRFFAGSYAWRRAPIYEFRLNGAEWSSLGTGSLLSFPGLREGAYLLDVRVANGQDTSGTPLSFAFEVEPPWQRTAVAYVLYVCAAFVLFGGLVRWSLNRARRRNFVLESQIQQRTQQLELAMRKLNEETRTAATLAERNRLAGEIHDSLQQGLSGLMLQIDATLKLQTLAEDVRSRLNVARNMVSFTRHEVQHAVWDLESPLLEASDLGEAFRKMVSLIGSGAAKIEVIVSGTPFALPSASKHHLVRMGQEAITNAVRHGNASSIGITLSYQPERFELTIVDDGIGFNPEHVLARSIGHFGLRGLRGRAAKIGARLQIQSSPGHGTSISITLNVSHPQSEVNDAAIL